MKKMNQRLGREITGFTPAAMELLLTCNYPGNIRELENIIEHGFVLCRGTEIDVDHLPANLNVAAGIAGSPLESWECTGVRFLERSRNMGLSCRGGMGGVLDFRFVILDF